MKKLLTLLLAVLLLAGLPAISPEHSNRTFPNK